jgi:hypothetical protein
MGPKGVAVSVTRLLMVLQRTSGREVLLLLHNRLQLVDGDEDAEPEFFCLPMNEWIRQDCPIPGLERGRRQGVGL